MSHLKIRWVWKFKHSPDSETEIFGNCCLNRTLERPSTGRKLRESSRAGDEAHANAQLCSVLCLGTFHAAHMHMHNASLTSFTPLQHCSCKCLRLLAHIFPPFLLFSPSHVLSSRQDQDKPNASQRFTFKTWSMCKSFSPGNLSWNFYQVQAKRLVFQFLKGTNYFISNKKLKTVSLQFSNE